MSDQKKSNDSEPDADSLIAPADSKTKSQHSLDLDENLSTPKSEQNSPLQNKHKSNITPLSKLSTILILTICLASLFALIQTFINTKNDFMESKEHISTSVPKNLKGSVLELKSINCGWELSPDLENNSPPSVIVPVITIKEAIGSDGYLQIVFKDAEGNIQGDPNTFQFDSKKNSFVTTQRNDLKVRATSGLENMLSFSSYKLANSKDSAGPWSATIQESGPSGEWSTLAVFGIPSSKLNSNN